MNKNNNNSTTGTNSSNLNAIKFVLEPLAFVPTKGDKPGKFIGMRLDTEPYKNGSPRKDLVLVVELEENNELGESVQVEQAFNLLPGGRGSSAFKKQMHSFFGQPLTAIQLAGLSAELVVGKSVTVRYKENHLGHVVFDAYLPAATTQPATA